MIPGHWVADCSGVNRKSKSRFTRPVAASEISYWREKKLAQWPKASSKEAVKGVEMFRLPAKKVFRIWRENLKPQASTE